MMRSNRPAFSLLEILLAIALTAVVMILVAGAIDFHLRKLTVHRARIQEAQIARAILRRIGDDLRAAVVVRQTDFSGVSTDGAADAGQGGDAGDGDAGSDADTEADAVVESAVTSEPGVYGSQNSIQIDMSRIPRYEEYALMEEFSDPTLSGGISDVKTVNYYLVESGQLSSMSTNSVGISSELAANGGLVRSVIPRATSRFAMEAGDFGLAEQAAELIAPEVISIEFSYFDGTEWTTEWDTELIGGIPMAVAITIIIQDPTTFVEGTVQEQQLTQENVYRTVVHLPGAEPIEDDSSTTEGSI